MWLSPEINFSGMAGSSCLLRKDIGPTSYDRLIISAIDNEARAALA
jgi:hypothetical protein